jgi:organic radical activating enzyme
MPASSPEARARKAAAKSAKMKSLRAETNRREAAGEPLGPEHQAIKDARSKRKIQYGDTKNILASGGKPTKKVSKAAVNRVLSRNTKLSKQISGAIPQPNMPDVYGSIDSSSGEALKQSSAVKSNPINTDKSHHSVLATVAQSLENKVNAAEDTGSLSERNVTAANSHVADFWAHHDSSLQAHDVGNPNMAKEHFKNAAESLIKLHTMLSGKSKIVLRPGIRNYIGQASRNYLYSNTPGVGAKPDENWKPKEVSYRAGSAPAKESEPIEETKEKINYAIQRRQIDDAAQNSTTILRAQNRNVYDVKINKTPKTTYATPEPEGWTPKPLASIQYSHFIRGSENER